MSVHGVTWVLPIPPPLALEQCSPRDPWPSLRLGCPARHNPPLACCARLPRHRRSTARGAPTRGAAPDLLTARVLATTRLSPDDGDSRATRAQAAAEHLQPAAEAAELGRMTWHQFRHIHAALLNDLRVPASAPRSSSGTRVSRRLSTSTTTCRCLASQGERSARTRVVPKCSQIAGWPEASRSGKS